MTRLITRADWRYASLSLAFLFLLVLVFYHQTVASVLAKWNQLQYGDYAHGYLVLVISLYLVFIKRKTLAALRPCENSLALVVVAISSLLWLVATAVDVQMVQAFALLLLLLSIIWTIMGNSIARQLLLPVLFLGFAIPVWSPLSPLLQELTADVVFWLTRAAGIPAMRLDNLIVLPSGRLSIEEACSGLRYLLAGLTLGVLYAWLNYHRTRDRLLVILVAAVAAVLSNIVRVFVVVYLAYTTGMQHPWVSDHLAFGWWLFGGVVVLLIVIDTVLSRYAMSGQDVHSGAIAPVAEHACSHGPLYHVGVLVVAAVLVISGPIIVSLLERQTRPGEAAIIDPPDGGRGWTGPEAAADSWTPRFHGALTSMQAYHKNDYTVLLYIGSYVAQSQGRELISDLNSIADESLWQLQYAHGHPVAQGDRKVLEQRMTSMDGQGRLVWYWYRVAGVPTSNEYMAKLLQVYGLVVGRPEAAVVAVATDIEEGEQESRQQLKDFIESSLE